MVELAMVEAFFPYPILFTYPVMPAALWFGKGWYPPLRLFLLPFAMLLIDVACCEREENSLSYPCANV